MSIGLKILAGFSILIVILLLFGANIYFAIQSIGGTSGTRRCFFSGRSSTMS